MLDALNQGQTRPLQCPCSQSQPRRGQSCSAPPRPWQLLFLLLSECSQSLRVGQLCWECCTDSGLFSGVPRHKPSQAQRLLLLLAIPSSGKQHVLSVIPHLAALRFQYGSQEKAGPGLLPPQAQHNPSQTSTEKPEL